VPRVPGTVVAVYARRQHLGVPRRGLATFQSMRRPLPQTRAVTWLSAAGAGLAGPVEGGPLTHSCTKPQPRQLL
jgi:hypothetical protein